MKCVEHDKNGKPLTRHCYNCKWKQGYYFSDLQCYCIVKHKNIKRSLGKIKARLCKYYEVNKEVR